MIPISPNENYKVIEEKLLTFLPTLKNKYDIFVSAPDLLGLDSVDGNEMVIKLLAHVKPECIFQDNVCFVKRSYNTSVKKAFIFQNQHL